MFPTVDELTIKSRYEERIEEARIERMISQIRKSQNSGLKGKVFTGLGRFLVGLGNRLQSTNMRTAN